MTYVASFSGLTILIAPSVFSNSCLFWCWFLYCIKSNKMLVAEEVPLLSIFIPFDPVCFEKNKDWNVKSLRITDDGSEVITILPWTLWADKKIIKHWINTNPQQSTSVYIITEHHYTLVVSTSISVVSIPLIVSNTRLIALQSYSPEHGQQRVTDSVEGNGV